MYNAPPVHPSSQSAIYRGTIRHRRFTPVKHDFRYRITMLMLDLDYIDQELNMPPLLGSRSAAIGWFRRRDYIGDGDQCLKQTIVDQVERQSGIRVEGKILLLTHLRYWGFVMNPISIFYCFDRDDNLVATALQVTNTPWREKILYILPTNAKHKNQCYTFDKEMHVSPFNPMNMEYLCRLRKPADTLFFHLENHQSGDTVTDATMVFQRQPMSRWQLLRLTLGQPAMTVRVGLGIYWQALRLWIKGSPVFDHPGTGKNNHDLIPQTTSLRNPE